MSLFENGNAIEISVRVKGVFVIVAFLSVSSHALMFVPDSGCSLILATKPSWSQRSGIFNMGCLKRKRETADLVAQKCFSVASIWHLKRHFIGMLVQCLGLHIVAIGRYLNLHSLDAIVICYYHCVFYPICNPSPPTQCKLFDAIVICNSLLVFVWDSENSWKYCHLQFPSKGFLELNISVAFPLHCTRIVSLIKSIACAFYSPSFLSLFQNK